MYEYLNTQKNYLVNFVLVLVLVVLSGLPLLVLSLPLLLLLLGLPLLLLLLHLLLLESGKAWIAISLLLIGSRRIVLIILNRNILGFILVKRLEWASLADVVVSLTFSMDGF